MTELREGVSRSSRVSAGGERLEASPGEEELASASEESLELLETAARMLEKREELFSRRGG